MSPPGPTVLDIVLKELDGLKEALTGQGGISDRLTTLEVQFREWIQQSERRTRWAIAVVGIVSGLCGSLGPKVWDAAFTHAAQAATAPRPSVTP